MATAQRESTCEASNRAIECVVRLLRGDEYWSGRFADALVGVRPARVIHLAVFVQPYLQYMLDGLKTIESRFSAVRCAPFMRVSAGDLVLLKVSGGPVVGVAEVGRTWFYRLDPASWTTIRHEFTDALCAQDPAFWESRRHASFATLMQVARVRPIPPLSWPKQDRRGWVVLTDSSPVLWE
jgi:hypothetical protein